MKIVKILFIALLILMGIVSVLYATLYFVYSGEYKVAETVEQDLSIPHITLDDITFHAETFGSDTNHMVVVIHGGPGNDYKYLLDLKGLSDEYFVVFYDQRGTGLSPRVPAEQHTKENMIEDLYRIVKYYGKGKKVKIIGHSWGGMLATAYAGRYPDTIDKLVLSEPGPLSPVVAKEFAAKFQPESSWVFLSHVIKSYFQSLHVNEIDDQARSDYFFQAFTSLSDSENNPMAGYFCNKDMSKAKFEKWRFSWTSYTELTLTHMQGDFSGIDFGKDAKNFKDKVLILVGSCNILIGEEFQKKQLQLFNNAEIVVIDDTGHFMFDEKPEECMAAIKNYFDDLE